MLTALLLALCAADAPIVSGNAPYFDATISESPYLGVGVALDGGWLVSGGLAFDHEEELNVDAYVYVQYMVVNQPKVGMGPSVTHELAGVDDGAVILGWQFYYLPWDAPITLGVQWGVRAEYVDVDVTATRLMTSALTISYAIPW